MQDRETLEKAPIRIFWKDGLSARWKNGDPWIVEPVTAVTLERLMVDWECSYTDFRRPNSTRMEEAPAKGEGEKVVPQPLSAPIDLDDGTADVAARHDDDSEEKEGYPEQSIPAWFDKAEGKQTVKLECNKVNRMLIQRKFSKQNDIAFKVSPLGTRIYYDDFLGMKELLFGGS